MRHITITATLSLLLSSPALAAPCTGSRNVKAGDVIACDGALLGPDKVAAIARLRAELDRCRHEVAAPLPQACTPVEVMVPTPPVKVVVERQSWTAALVAGAVGLVVGAAVVMAAGGAR